MGGGGRGGGDGEREEAVKSPTELSTGEFLMFAVQTKIKLSGSMRFLRTETSLESENCLRVHTKPVRSDSLSYLKAACQFTPNLFGLILCRFI